MFVCDDRVMISHAHHLEGAAVMQGLDGLDRKIIGALQVDGRASWRRIASVLGESFSTVTRRGNALLESGLVRIAAMDNVPRSVVIQIRCPPARLQEIAETWRDDPDVIFVLVLSAPSSVVIEVRQRAERGPAQLLQELAQVEGVVDAAVSPVLRYHRTLGQWRPGVITAAEADELDHRTPMAMAVAPDDRSDEEQTVAGLLVEDGRLGAAEIGARIGVSESKARRLVASLIRRGSIDIRAVVAPSALGLGIETWMSVDAAAADVDRVAAGLSDQVSVRYAVTVAGERPLLVHAAFADGEALAEFLASPLFAGEVRVRTSVVAWAVRRGGVQVDEGRVTSSE
jgi:DNA-binding Lrp family transcriptional regulator